MGYRLTKIYTKTGDDGSTSLDGKHRLPKNHVQIEAIGSLDELNCAIGLVLSLSPLDPEVKICLQHVQNDLFDIGGELCFPDRPVITAERTTSLETQLDHWNNTLPRLKEFILPGGSPASASCHFARAICRRAERHIISLHQEQAINLEIVKYINRLSDLLFVVARILGRDTGSEEIFWAHQRKKALKQ